MKVLLTGITGNLGYEVALDLSRRGIEVIPIVRPGKRESLLTSPVRFPSVVENDLACGETLVFRGTADCIVHCAGVVNFRNAGNANETMMRNVIDLAEAQKIPLYFVSTAFVYRPPGSRPDFNNSYEEDKYRAEQVLAASGVPHAIFRPSVLTGNSRTGSIQNFSGYYSLVRAFLFAVRDSALRNRTLRFPRMIGTSDMVPVDQAAEHIGQIVQEGKQLGILYVTNPAPPKSEWVLDETMNFYGVRDGVTVVDVSVEEYGKLDLTEEETKLYRFISHFSPYWSMKYDFPYSVCTDNLITKEYISVALGYFRDAEKLTYEQRNN